MVIGSRPLTWTPEALDAAIDKGFGVAIASRGTQCQSLLFFKVEYRILY